MCRAMMNSSKRLAVVVIFVTTLVALAGVSATDSKITTTNLAETTTSNLTSEAQDISKTTNVDPTLKPGVTLATEAPKASIDPLPTTHAPSIVAEVQAAAAASATSSSKVNSTSVHDKSNVSNVTVSKVESQTTASPIPAAIKPLTLAVPMTVEDRLIQYFEPICGAFESITPKQLFKIQSQLKQFVEKTSGKLSVCFMRSFKIDPNLDPISKPQLTKICSGTKLKPEDVGSFKMFAECATQHWDPILNSDLERIHLARSHCVKNHNHSKNDTAASLIHDSVIDESLDELSLIGDMVSKVLDNPSSIVNKTDIKVIDMSNSASGSKSQSIGGQSTTVAPIQLNTKRLLSDPNTVLVFVDEPNAKASTIKPAAVSLDSGDKSKHPTIKSMEISLDSKTDNSTAKLAAATTASPTGLAGSRILVSDSSASAETAAATETKTTTTTTSTVSTNSTSPMTKTTTAKPSLDAATTAKASVSIVTKIDDATASPKKDSSANKPTTRGPIVSLIKSATTPAAKAGAEKPLGTLQDLLARQEKEKQDFEGKLKLEREKTLKQMQKKQDEMDAKNAMRALQVQRAKSSEHSDAKMHQIEHERQMSIDPIGHTIKHQQYELSKQQKAG